MPRKAKPPTAGALKTYMLAEQEPLIDERCGGWHVVYTGLHRGARVLECLQKLPAAPEQHIRGFLASRYAHFRIGGEDEYLPLRPRQWQRNPYRVYAKDAPKEVVFHSQPTGCIYSEIPAREDIYWFLKWPHRVLVTVGRKRIGVLRKDERTNRCAERLSDWERDSRARMRRIIKRHPDKSPRHHFRHYAFAALRALDLEWPGKLSKRRKFWPLVLEEFGLDVTVVQRVSS